MSLDTVKVCTKCGEEREFGEFAVRKSKSGRASACKECNNDAGRSSYVVRKSLPDKKAKMDAANVKYREANRFVKPLKTAACAAINRGYAPCTATEVEIREAFTGRCDACSVLEIECNTKLHLDHNHETGAFRGWLCSNCNRALGLLHDSSERITALQTYLEERSNVIEC